MKTPPECCSRLLLNGEWEFVEGPDSAPPTCGWQQVRVPHRSREFEPEPPASGWYRTSLRVPAHWQVGQSRLFLDLGRVRHYGRAYLDGQVVGEHWGMRLPWRLELTHLAQPGRQHELWVYAHPCAGGYAHPGAAQLGQAAERALDTRFWYTSAATIGMEGDVWLCLEPRLRLAEVYVTTSVRHWTLSADLTVCNETEKDVDVRLELAITRGGRVELELPAQELRVGAGATRPVRVQVPWPDPVLWGHPPYGQPVLYFLQAALYLGGAPAAVHSCAVRFGFREVWAEEDRLLLNGQPLMLWGDHSIPYVHERQWLTRKLVDLADSGLSVVEHHRYDAPPVLYEVADELGMFVVSANFCVGTGQVPEALGQEEQRLVQAHHLAVCAAWIRRDRNHPSILLWDVTDAREPDFCIPLLRQVKALDSTRPVEVTFDPQRASPELLELIDTYRLFSGLEQIEAAIRAIREQPQYPVKPIRVGEAGIFAANAWPADAQPPLMAGWLDFLLGMPQRQIHGLQTFYLTDMDYRNFELQVPGTLAAPVHPRITWPSQSGLDARIDPFGQGTQAAWGKAALYLNWCDPAGPVSRPTATRQWSRELFGKLAGRDMGPLAAQRVPEVIVQVERMGKPVPGAQVFVEPLEGQGLTRFGVQADRAGTSWFTLPEEGLYRFTCEEGQVEASARSAPIAAPPGYRHIQHVRLVLD